MILSLVRTKSVGHLRDLRRLTVALSRASLGLYILGRYSVFQEVFAAANLTEKFSTRDPFKLILYPQESYVSPEQPCTRSLSSTADAVATKGKKGEANVVSLEMENVQDLGKFIYERLQEK